MNGKENAVLNANMIDTENFDFDELERQLEADIDDSMSEFEFLEEEKNKIGNPESLGNAILGVVWDQAIIQIGSVAGEDFIKENQGLRFDISDDAHIQTAENFSKGIIAEHNSISADQLKENYDRYQNMPHKQFREKYVNPGMNKTLERAGKLNERGVETVTDIYTGRQIPTKTKMEDGRNNPKAAQREHVIPSDNLYKNPSLQMANGNEELAAVINNPENLQGYTTADRNNRKSANLGDEMEPRDKNKHWEKANERAEDFVKSEERKGEERLKAEGRQTQKEEAFKLGGKALKAAVMGLLAELIRNIIGKLIAWFKSKEKSFKTFIGQVKDAIAAFLTDVKRNLLTAGTTIASAVLTSIFEPIAGVLQAIWAFIKQGVKSLKEAIDYVKNPDNRKLPFDIMVLEVGKIIVAGATAMAAGALGKVIEETLNRVPVFGFKIPLLDFSLASLIGIFLGAVVAGIAGALVLNLIDKIIAKKKKDEAVKQQIDKGNEVLAKQSQLQEVYEEHLKQKKAKVHDSIKENHERAGEAIQNSLKAIEDTMGTESEDELLRLIDSTLG